VDEFYAELQIPILSDLPFARELSFNVASRYSDYDTFGETTNNKFGLKWKPFDSLLLRATAADGFRAPTINDLFGGGSQTFSFYTDPCDTAFGAAATDATVQARCAQDIVDAANFRQLCRSSPVPTRTCCRRPRARRRWAWCGARASPSGSTCRWTGGPSASTTRWSPTRRRRCSRTATC
jgi:iron complex outermembrane receptor protein